MNAPDPAATPTTSIADSVLLDALMSSSPDTIYFKDRRSRFLRVNASLARKHGRASPSELVGRSDFDSFGEAQARPRFEAEQRIIRTGQPLLNFEEKETWPDGSVSWVSTSKMPLRDATGAIIGTFGVSRDITERKLTEDRLEVTRKELLEASRLAGMAEIASGVLHNIGNGINSVNTSVAMIADTLKRSRTQNLAKIADMLAQHTDDMNAFLTQDERGRKIPGYLCQLAALVTAEQQTLLEEVERLRGSIEHIKEIVAMQQGYARASAIVEDIAPATMVDEAIHISEMSLNRHGVDVAREFDAAPLVRVSRHKVLQILVNFIRNAKYAMDETGRPDKVMRISIGTTASGHVEINVTDNGVGIAPENLDQIFGFGFTTRKEGHGFGLHSSANAAKEIGGRIRVESEGVGKGARFTLELPAASTASEEQAA